MEKSKVIEIYIGRYKDFAKKNKKRVDETSVNTLREFLESELA